jgi:hypothetical protein
MILSDDDLGAGPSVLEHAIGVDPGYVKKALAEMQAKLTGIEFLLYFAAAGGISAALAAIITARRR